MKIGVFYAIIILFADTKTFKTRVIALSVVACTISWTVAAMWVYEKTKVLNVEPVVKS